MKKILLPFYILFILLGLSLAWDNTKFIDQSFWNGNPSTGEIVNALYGTGNGTWRITAYTRYRSGGSSCDPADMNVENIPAFNSTSGNYFAPQSLAANTIYVLTWWAYITTGQIYMWGNCSAILGRSTTTLYSRDYIGWSIATLRLQSSSYHILDSIWIDALSNGLTWYHEQNYTNIFLGHNTHCNTLHNVKTYNAHVWLDLSYSNYNLIEDTQIYNNSYWIITFASNYNLINNSQINHWSIYFTDYSSYNIVSNSQLALISNQRWGQNANVIHNCMIYNGWSWGIQASYQVLPYSYFILHDVRVFNNEAGFNIASSWHLYYGNLNVFWNGSPYIPLSSDILASGNNTDPIVTQVGRSWWVLSTGKQVSRALFTNSMNTFNQKLFTTWTFSSFRSRKNRTWTSNIQYFYWPKIPYQQQPVMRSGDVLVPYGLSGTDRDASKPIALLVGDIWWTLNCLPILMPLTNTWICFSQPEIYWSLFSANQTYWFSLPMNNLDGDLTNQSFKFLHHVFTIPSVSQGEESEVQIKVKTFMDDVAE